MKPSQALKRIIDSYFDRFHEETIQAGDWITRGRNLREAFREWADLNDPQRGVATYVRFTACLRERGYRARRLPGGWEWVGFRIRPEVLKPLLERREAARISATLPPE